MFTRHHRHHHFFKNKELNELYTSIFIMNLAENLMCVFVPIYLYTLGYSLVNIIFFYFLSNLTSVLFAVPAAKLVGRVGPKYSILISTFPLALYYYGFEFLAGNSIIFYILPILVSASALFYNFGFDLNFIAHADREKMGSEISIMGVMAVLSTVVSPLAAGFIVLALGYKMLFAIGGALLIFSALPLFLSGNGHRTVRTSLKSILKCARGEPMRTASWSFGGYAIETSIGRILWPIFLFIILKMSDRVGIVVSASAFLTVVVLSLVGKMVDRYDKQKLLRFGTMFYFFGWVGTLFASDALRVMFVESYRKLAERFILLPWSASFYLFIRKRAYFESVVARDMIFNMARVLILPLLMLVFYFDVVPFTVAFLAAAFFTLFYPFLPKSADR